MALVFKLVAPNHSLYGVLRRIMFTTGVGLFDHDWEVVTLETMVHRPEPAAEKVSLNAFPEFEDKVPFRVSGERLMERMGLLWDTDDVEIHRMTGATSLDYDLVLYAETGGIVNISTSDEELFEALSHWISQTTGDQFRSCFL